MAQNNYINRLENDLAAANAYMLSMENELAALRGYLASDKFAIDPTVQVRDVDTRIREAMWAAISGKTV